VDQQLTTTALRASYQLEPGRQAQRLGNRATSQAGITTRRGERLQPSFELEQSPQPGLWKIGSLEDLASLSHQRLERMDVPSGRIQAAR